MAPASFPGLQELPRQSKGQIKIHQPGKTAGISVSLPRHRGKFPAANSPQTNSRSHPWVPCHGDPSTDPRPDQIHPRSYLASPLLAAAPIPSGMCRGFLWPSPSRQDVGREIFPWPRGSPTSPKDQGKGSGSFFSSERALAGKGLVSQGLEPNPWGLLAEGAGKGMRYSRGGVEALSSRECIPKLSGTWTLLQPGNPHFPPIPTQKKP